MRFVIFVSFLLQHDLCISIDVKESSPRVITTLGTIEGYVKISNEGRRYEAYEGIPYAQPPIGDFRFRDARRVLPWTGEILMAKRFGPNCIQYNLAPGIEPSQRTSGSEDCLYLNIYTPISTEYDGSRRRKVLREPIDFLPVIFFIHGGAFQMGSGSTYGAKYLMDKDVVTVTINYRLGPMGFLSTEDSMVPGNLGLKDQVIALHWVKDNIESFGGDPSRISLFGQSSGAASVHYHYLSKLTKGLFCGGMSMSGTALNPWSLAEKPLEKAERLSAAVGCPINDTKSMVDCLRTRPANTILNAVEIFQTHPASFAITFTPSVEKGGNEFTFIDRHPVDIIASGDAHDVPWITGIVSEDGLVPAAFYVLNKQLLDELDEQWETEASDLLYYKDTIPDVDKPKVARLIREHYFGESPISWSTFNQTLQMLTDRLFAYSCEKAARFQAQAKRGPVYGYYFSYRGNHSLTETVGIIENLGVCHGDDLCYVLEPTFEISPMTEDWRIQNTLINLWVSFATNGKPDVGVDWPELSPSSADEYRFLHIAGPDEIGMESASNFGQKKFWNSLDFQENIRTTET